LPRHIEHHLNLFSNSRNVPKWSYSYVEFKDSSAQNDILNNLGWRIDFPKQEQFIIDELCHSKSIIPDWKSCVVTKNENAFFTPSNILKDIRQYPVLNPEEITVQQWLNQQQRQIILGAPASSEIKETVEENDEGVLEIKRLIPTIMGNIQFASRNDQLLNSLIHDKVRKIAIKRSMGLGDVILTEPIVRALKTKYPKATVTLFTTNYASSDTIAKMFSELDNIVVIDPSKLIEDYLYQVNDQYDLKIDLDLAYESRPGMRYVDAYLEVCGFKEGVFEVNGELTVNRGFDNDFLVPRLRFEDSPMLNEKYVTMTLEGSGWGGKQWIIDGWKKIIKLLNDKGYKVVLTSNAVSIDQFDGLNVMMNANNDFITMISLIKHGLAHFGADNGPMHIATAFKKPTFVISGAALTKNTTPFKDIFSVYKEDLQCIGCKHRFFFSPQGGSITFVPSCTNSNQFACMKTLTEEHVLGKVNEFCEKYKL
jgi:ADP-heptose:LPS heptosyltransferase